MSTLQKLWTEKYRPTKVENYIFQDKAQKTAFLKMILDQSLPHVMLSGIQGTGKTSLAKLLIAELGIDELDVLEINASDETSVDVVREKVLPFIKSFAIGEYKVVLLEEADMMSPSAQKAMKHILEDMSDVVRFIITCNEEHKIIPPIKSRFQQYRFKSHSLVQVQLLVQGILDTENVTFDDDDVVQFIKAAYPDIRKTINLLQQFSSSGKLLPSEGSSENAEYKYKLLEQIEADDWFGIRDNVLPLIQAGEWDQMYQYIYENLHHSPKLKADLASMKAAIVNIAEYMYRHTLSADPLINACALVIRLDEI